MNRLLPGLLLLALLGGPALAQPTPVGGNTGEGGGLPVASQAEAEAGAVNNKTMTPLRTAQAIAEQALAAVQEELDLKRDLSLSTNAQTGTSYTFVAEDAGKLVTFTNASSIEATIPANDTVSLPIGTRIDNQQGGAGAVTFVAAGGVSLTLRSGTAVIGAAGHYASLLKTGTDAWELTVEPLDRSTTSDPGTGDDTADGYQVGSIWRNTSSGCVFYCLDNTATAAVWQQINPNSTQLGTHSSPDTTGGAVTWSGPVHAIWTNTTTEYDLPAAAGYAGRAVVFYVTGTNAITIDPNASEVIVRDGTAQTGGVTLTLTGAAGNYVALFCTGTRWVTLGYKGTLAAGS
jgi:hypothetical protein